MDDAGGFRPLRIEEIVVPEHAEEIRDLCQHVFKAGKAVKAYGPSDEFSDIFERLRGTLRPHESHVPSSLQWVDLRLRTGRLDVSVPPTESWLLDPLIRYARSAGLDEDGHYFEDLKERLMEKLARLACGRAGSASGGNWDFSTRGGGGGQPSRRKRQGTNNHYFVARANRDEGRVRL